MKGRTRSFFEDFFVLLLVGGVLGGGYYFFFYNEEVQNSPVQKEKEVSQPEPILEENIEAVDTIEDEIVADANSSKVEDNSSIKPVQKEQNSTSQTKIQKPQIKKEEKAEVINTNEEVTKQVDPKRIAHLVKNVDLKALQKFKKDVKNAMKNSVILDQDIDKKEQNFSIRVTVLKNGGFEQLVYTGGNKEIYEKNTDNILSIFPLEISSKIEQDFPRYLRYSFDFSEQ